MRNPTNARPTRDVDGRAGCIGAADSTDPCAHLKHGRRRSHHKPYALFATLYVASPVCKEQ